MKKSTHKKGTSSFIIKMGTIYNGAGGPGLAVILQNSCCLGCMQDFETGFGDARYPFISGVCSCTVCRRCLDARVEAERGENPAASWKGGCICCPVCDTDRAFNMKKLVKNMALAVVLAEIGRLIDRQPDNGDDDLSNVGDDYEDDGTKRKRRE